MKERGGVKNSEMSDLCDKSGAYNEEIRGDVNQKVYCEILTKRRMVAQKYIRRFTVDW